MKSPRSHRLASSAAGSFPAAEEVERLKCQLGFRLPNKPSVSPFGPAVEKRGVARPPFAFLVPEGNVRRPADEDRLPIGVAHLAKKLAALRIEGVDMTVAEISDPQGAAQFTETSRR